jgi:Tfp pilus assembly protein PilO
MNQMNSRILASIVVLVIVFFLARLVMLSGPAREIAQLHNRLQQLEESKAIKEIELEKHRKQARQEVKLERSNTLLKPGQEYNLLKQILACSGNMSIQNFAILPSYRVKNKDDEFMSDNYEVKNYNAGDELPQIDEQGNPVGMVTDDDVEWPGVEIVPVKLSFTTTYRSLGQFFSQVLRSMPINVVRSMDIMVKDSGISKGTVVLLFPVSEK